MEQNEETWKPIKGYEGLYEVSNLGRVKSLPKVVNFIDGRVRYYKEKIMKLSSSGKRKNAEKGYLQVRLTKNKKDKIYLVHRLVAETFLDNPYNKPTVNHIDGDKHNNCVWNLEWNTFSENNQHAYDNNLKTDNRMVIMLDEDDNELKIFNSLHEAGRYINCNFRNIWFVCNGKRQYAGGYKWKYK